MNWYCYCCCCCCWLMLLLLMMIETWRKMVLNHLIQQRRDSLYTAFFLDIIFLARHRHLNQNPGLGIRLTRTQGGRTLVNIGRKKRSWSWKVISVPVLIGSLGFDSWSLSCAAGKDHKKRFNSIERVIFFVILLERAFRGFWITKTLKKAHPFSKCFIWFFINMRIFLLLRHIKLD